MTEKIQKHKVVVHVASPAHIVNNRVPGFSYGLDVYHIKYTIQVDNPVLNRHYPYVTVNEKIFCIKRVIRMKQGGSL